jgi:hypothetical protein
MPPAFLAVPLTVLSLLLAVVALVAVARNRKPDRLVWLGAVTVEALVVAVAVAGAVRLGQGGHPREYATFVGYLIAVLLVLPLGVTLARMEPTRWGSVIMAVAAVVIPVLLLRLNQLWSGGA